MCCGKCEDVAADLIGLLVPAEPEHMVAIVEPIKIGQLLRAIDGYTVQPLIRLALKLVPCIFPLCENRRARHTNLVAPNDICSIDLRALQFFNSGAWPFVRQALWGGTI